jgi:formate dehydrogenase subunit delta
VNVERLVTMANDIGAFFASEPDPAEGARGVANHLQRFWAPTMRAALLEHWRRGGLGLSSLAGAALEQLVTAENLKKTKNLPTS